MKQRNSISVRPTKRAQPTVDRLVAEGKWNRLMNDFIESLDADSPPILRLEMDELNKERDELVAEREKITKRVGEIDTSLANRQSRLNALIHKSDSVIGAQKEIIGQWATCLKQGLKGEIAFRGWITGPANLETMTRAGFKNEDQVVQWCRGAGQ